MRGTLTERLIWNLRARLYPLWHPATVSVAGIRVRTPHLPPKIRQDVYTGNYEAQELRGIRALLTPQDRVMELGAGLGVISAYCAKRVSSEHVVTYEANPALAETLKSTHTLNGVHPCVILACIGRETTPKTFYTQPEFNGSSVIKRQEQMQSLTVPQRDLQEELEHWRPTFLIVDVEGAEVGLFEGLDFHAVRAISIEFHSKIVGLEATQGVQRALAEAGFQRVPKYSRDEKWLLTRGGQ